MKTLWILLATLTPMVLAGCGGQAESDSSDPSSGNDETEEMNEEDATEAARDQEGDGAEPEEEPESDEGIAGDDPGAVEDVDRDGDVDEDDEQLSRLADALDVEFEDVDDDGDIDTDDVAATLKEEFDIGDEELDVTGDGTFDESDIDTIAELASSQPDQDIAVDGAASSGVAVSTGGFAPSPGIATQPPRPVPIGPGTPGGGLPDLGECQEDRRSSGPDYCDIGYTCDAGYMYGSCWNEGNGVMYCDCGGEGETGYGYANYQLTDVSAADACNTLMDLCTAEVQPEFSGEPECVPEYQSASDDWCDMSLRCSQSAELDNGATALLSEYESVSCYQNEDGNRRCECYGPQSRVGFDLEGSGGLDTCIEALDICDSIETVETDEPLECEFEYQSSSQNWCDAQLACTKTALAGGVEIEIAEAANVNCQLAGEGLWMCGCYSSTEASSFELQSDASAWDTCTEAVEVCTGG